MYARSSTFGGSPENSDLGLRFVDTEARPMLESMDGYRGLSVLIDRDSGECIATSSWSSAEAMRASADQIHPIRERGSEMFGGPLAVDEWEIAMMHREHRTADGSCCRVSWLQSDPIAIDESLDAIRDELGRIEELAGFCSISVMLNPSTGMVCMTTTYGSQDSLELNRAMSDQIRAAICDTTGMETTAVKEYELAMAHLHVPELV